MCGGVWYGLTQGLRLPRSARGVVIIPRVLHLGVYPTILTGVLALGLGFLLMGYLWLSIDLSRPAPVGIDRNERELQLFILWLGVPLVVVLVCALVALIAVAVAHFALSSGLRT
jgi:hypothetical protein